MAFLQKTDFGGLATKFNSALQVRDDNANPSAENYRPVSNDGEIFANEVYGEDSAPSNSYALKATLENKANDPLMIGAGAITTVDSKKFALESLNINTGAGNPVSIDASTQELESGADGTGTKFVVPPFTVETKHKAQDIFGAISAITNATMTKLDHAIGCTITKDKIAGTKISSGANAGLITITGTLLQKSTANNAAAVSLTVASGWTLDQAPARTNPESAYPEYAFTITKALELYVAPAQ